MIYKRLQIFKEKVANGDASKPVLQKIPQPIPVNYRLTYPPKILTAPQLNIPVRPIAVPETRIQQARTFEQLPFKPPGVVANNIYLRSGASGQKLVFISKLMKGPHNAVEHQPLTYQKMNPVSTNTQNIIKRPSAGLIVKSQVAANVDSTADTAITELLKPTEPIHIRKRLNKKTETTEGEPFEKIQIVEETDPLELPTNGCDDYVDYNRVTVEVLRIDSENPLHQQEENKNDMEEDQERDQEQLQCKELDLEKETVEILIDSSSEDDEVLTKTASSSIMQTTTTVAAKTPDKDKAKGISFLKKTFLNNSTSSDVNINMDVVSFEKINGLKLLLHITNICHCTP